MEIKPNIKPENEDWFLVDENGKLKCSCGRELVQVDEETWASSYGYPMYKLDDIKIDKFGNVYIKNKEH